MKSDKCSAEDILQYKEEHIAKTLEYAYQHCPYYKARFKEFGLSAKDFKQLDDLQKFPTLTKEEVRTYWMGMLSDEANHKEMIAYHTSGSTGKALDFFWTKESLRFYWASVWRARYRAGINKGDCHVNFTGKLVVPFLQNKPPYWRYNRAINQYMINQQHITKEKVPAIVDFFNSHDIRFIVGYPSIAFAFAQFVEELGLTIKHVPKCMFPSAEKLYDWQREQIESVFPGMEIWQHYGFSENVAAASMCCNKHYHEDWEMGHLELSKISPVADGLSGEMIATGFKNFAMPFIRYEIGDRAVFSPEICSCGINSQTILDIEGRSEDYIITPEGSHITRLDYLFKEARQTKECQVVQQELGSIIVRVVKRPDYNSQSEKQIIEAVHSIISPTIKIEFEYLDEIPRTKAGKFRAVVSEITKPSNKKL